MDDAATENNQDVKPNNDGFWAVMHARDDLLIAMAQYGEFSRKEGHKPPYNPLAMIIALVETLLEAVNGYERTRGEKEKELAPCVRDIIFSFISARFLDKKEAAYGFLNWIPHHENPDKADSFLQEYEWLFKKDDASQGDAA